MEQLVHKHTEIRQHSMAIYDMVIANADVVYTAGADKFIVRWKLDLGIQDNFTIKADFPVYSLELIRNEIISIGLNNGHLHFIDVVQKQELKFYTQHKSAIFSQLHLTQHNLLLTGDAEGYLAVWDTHSYKLQLFIPLACGKIRSIAANHDESRIAVGGQDGIIRVFETTYFNEINRFFAHNDGVSSLAFEPHQSTKLVSGGKDGYLRIWNSDSGEKIKAIPAHHYAIYGICFNSTGTYFATCSRDKSIKIWENASYSVLQKLEAKQGGHTHSVNSIKWIDQYLISCGDDRRLIRWKLDNLR